LEKKLYKKYFNITIGRKKVKSPNDRNLPFRVSKDHQKIFILEVTKLVEGLILPLGLD